MPIPHPVTIVEVGPRDGFQPIVTIVPTHIKLELIRKLHAAGIRRMEVTAFVSDSAVPQMADAVEVLQFASSLPGLDAQVLVPNQRHAQRALAAGAHHLAFVLSVSEKHNRNNVRRSPSESIEEYRRIVHELPSTVRVRVSVATAFDCPYDGPVDEAATLSMIDQLIAIRGDVEVALCDTTGRVTPDRVGSLFGAAKGRVAAGTRWAFHGHDTYGLGVANVLAAWHSGVEVIDSSFAGLGGCPFAPGATGNVATEDIVWTLNKMNVSTGVDLAALLEVSRAAEQLPGAQSGGRVRQALRVTAHHVAALRPSSGQS